MVDKSKLLVIGKINTESDSIERVFGKNGQYRLYNQQRDHSLIIEMRKGDVILEGSWRKWYYGSSSFDDLPISLLPKVAEMIAFETGLSAKAILKGQILTIEVGVNFTLPILPIAIVNSAFRYSTFRLARYDTSISFQGNDYWLALYDKTVEINEARRKKKIPALDITSNVLRIELKAFKNTALQNKLRKIETLEDVIKSYRMLIVSLLKEIKRIEMSPMNLTVDNVRFTGGKKKDLRQYLMYIGMECRGVRNAYQYIKQLEIADPKKSEMVKEFREIIAMYDRKMPYRKCDFIEGVIKKQLAKKISEPKPRI